MAEKQTVYDFITTEEANFRATPIEIVDGLQFSFYETVRTATLYKNSELLTGKDDDKPVKNIILPLLRLQYRSEGFDVKDIDIYIDDPEYYFKSFLVRKFHQKWALENGLDTFIDEFVESYVDLGTALVKDVNALKPEIEKLQAIAFCDQTDILSGPICFKRAYAPNQLRDMTANGWYGDSIETVIELAGFYKTDQRGVKQNKTPGKYIEVYELHGVLPASWLDQNEPDDEGAESAANEKSENDLVRQLQIVTFYSDDKGNKHGITLFAGKESDPFDVLLRDPIYGRALGLGGAEELFEAQVWTTYDQIRLKGLLDAASKVIYETTDPTIAAKHPSGLKDLENGEMIEHEPNTTFGQVNTASPNITLFERSAQEWYSHAQEIAGASPYLLGGGQGTGGKDAFRAIAALIQQGQALHDYRQGKIAVFFEKLYRTRFLPAFAKEMTNGARFLSELSIDELQQIADSLVACELSDWKKEKVLNGETWSDLEAQQQEQQIRADFMKGGTKRFIEILKGEMKNLPLEVKISIKSKQQDFAGMVQKLTNILQMIIQTGGQILQDPVMAKLFNEILEYSGLEPLDFSGMKSYQPNQPQPNPQGPTPTPAAPAAPAMPVPQMVMAKQ